MGGRTAAAGGSAPPGCTPGGMRTAIRSACCLLLALAAVRAADVPAVPLIADAHAAAIVVVPDLAAAIANLERTCQAAGLPLPPGVLAMQAGAVIGDPGLAGIAGKPIVLALAPGMPMPSWCAILPIADAKALRALTASGANAAEAVPGGVAVGSAVGGLELARRIAPSVPALAAAVPAGVDLRLLLAGDRLTRSYLPMLVALMQQGLMQQSRLLGKADDPAEQRKNRALASLIQAGLSQAGPLCLDVASTAAGWRLDALAGVAPGPIAEALRPLPASAAPDLLPRLAAGASPPVIVVAGRLPPALYAGVGRFLERARADAAVAALVDPALVRLCVEAAAVFDGRFAMRQGIDGNPFLHIGAQGVADAAGCARFMGSLRELLAAGGMAELLAVSGLQLTWQADARRSAGVPVDRLVYEVIPGKMPPDQERLMQQVLQPVEMAQAGEILAYGAPAAEIDRILAGTPPAAVPAMRAAALPGAWDLLLDWDLALQLQQQFALMAQQAANPLQGVRGGDPVRIAVAFGDARVRTAVLIPVGMVAEFAAAGRPGRRADGQ